MCKSINIFAVAKFVPSFWLSTPEIVHFIGIKKKGPCTKEDKSLLSTDDLDYNTKNRLRRCQVSENPTHSRNPDDYSLVCDRED